MGWNGNGEFGDGTAGSNNYTNKPELIVANDVVEIAMGEGTVFFENPMAASG